MEAERANAMFRAFADETRLRILSLLRKGEICVGDLVEILQVPQPTASRHLAYLRKAGLVNARKDGLWVFYSLATPTGTVHGALVRCLKSCFRDIPQLEEDEARASFLKQSGRCHRQ
jgi:ArsR family transcriptional regulator